MKNEFSGDIWTRETSQSRGNLQVIHSGMCGAEDKCVLDLYK